MSEIRIAIAGDCLVAEALRTALKDQFTVIKACSTASEAIRIASHMRPEVILFDPYIFESRTMAIIQELKAIAPGVRLLCFCRHRDALVASLVVERLIDGLVLKQQGLQDLCAAIQIVASGGKYYDPRWARQDSSISTDNLSGAGANHRLTPRQRDVLRYIAEGRTSKAIGTLLGISPKTVEFHRAQLSEVLGVRTIAELTRFALLYGLIDPVVRLNPNPQISGRPSLDVQGNFLVP